MSLTNPNTPVSQQDLQDFYHKLLPYMGGSFGAIANKFSKGDVYSTDEKMIGQWYDGKPLYQQVVTGAISQTGWNTFNHNIANIDTVVKIEAFLTALNSQSIPFVYSLGRTVANDGMMASFNPSTWGVNVSSGFASGTATAILQYTKTTDTAISIGDDTDYSTEEKIIGTWIDGSPVYQKTWTGQTTTATSVDLFTIDGADTIVDIRGEISSSGYNFPLNYTIVLSNSQVQYFSVFESNTTIKLRKSESSNYNYTITIQYTKTTD